MTDVVAQVLPTGWGGGLLPVRVVNLLPIRQMQVTAAGTQIVALAEGCMSVQAVYEAATLLIGLQFLEHWLPPLECRGCPHQLLPDAAVCRKRESGDLKTILLH